MDMMGGIGMKRVVIFGRGREGAILKHTLSDEYSIAYFADNSVSSGETSWYLNLPVRNPDYLRHDKDWDIIVVSTIRYFAEISRQLELMGFAYGKDYISAYDLVHKVPVIEAELFIDCSMEIFKKSIKRALKGRELAIVYGNCQSQLIVQILAESREFKKKYLLLKLPPVHYDSCYNVCDYIKCSGVLGECRLFIAQAVKEKPKFKRFSTDYLHENLSEECKTILIPDLYFRGYFPDAYDLPHDERVLPVFFGTTGLFAYGYRTVDKGIAENKTAQDIIRSVCNDQLYSEDFCRCRIEEELREYDHREDERKLDVRMHDYLSENYDKKLLFHSFHHPDIDVLVKLCNRILD